MTQQPERRDLRVCAFISLLVLGLVNVVLAQSDGDIHRVNFQDFIYRPSCASEDAEPQIRTRNGKYEVYNDKEQIGFTVSTPAYGDLTNDGVDEAVILSVCNTGGSGQFSEGFIYTMRGGKPLLLARIPGGDRASGGLHNLTVERGLLVVESYAMKDTSGLCCPDFIDTTRYRWDGRKLVQAGKTIRRTYLTSPRDQESQGRLESVPEQLALENYGKQLASSTPNNAITLSIVTKTMEQPMRAYALQFQTAAKELMKDPNAQNDIVAYWSNRGKTELWQTKFCTAQLKQIMTTFKINLVSGRLTDMKGEIQSMAICSSGS